MTIRNLMMILMLAAPSLAPAGSTATVTLTTLDGSASEEGQGEAVFRFTRSGGNIGATLSVLTADQSSTTVDFTDYESSNGSAFESFRTVTFGAGETVFDLTLTPELDNRVEGEERMDIQLVDNGAGQYTIGSPATASFTLADDPPVITLDAFDGEAAEAGQDVAVFRFARSGGNIGATLSVLTADDPTTTIEFTDYESSNGSQFESFRGISFGAGQSSFDLTLTPELDNRVEGEERMDIQLVDNGAGQYTIGSPAAASFTLADDPPVITLDAFDGEAAEAGQDVAVFRFARSGGNIGATLSVLTADDPTTTIEFTDYESSNGSQFESFRGISFGAGQSSFDLTLTPELDNRVEGEERMDIQLVDNNAGQYTIGSPAAASFTLADDPPVITLDAFDGEAVEAGQDVAVFRFARSGGNIGATLSVLTADDPTTTIEFTDYESSNGSQFESFRGISFGAGQSSFDLTLTPELDNRVEGEERMDIQLVDNGAGQYTIGSPAAASFTLADDPPVVTLEAIESRVVEGVGSGVFRFSRSGGRIGQGFSVLVSDDAATTVSASDFEDSNGGSFRSFRTVNFQNGESQFDLVITAVIDNIREEDEFLNIRLNPTTFLAGTPEAASMVFIDLNLFEDSFEESPTEKCSLISFRMQAPVRFFHLGDRIVDLKTDLQWRRCPIGLNYDWVTGLCGIGVLKNLEVALQSPWRTATSTEKAEAGATGDCLVR